MPTERATTAVMCRNDAIRRLLNRTGISLRSLSVDEFSLLQTRIPKEVLEPVADLKATKRLVILDRGGRAVSTPYSNVASMNSFASSLVRPAPQ
jgi:hypothetical protein